MGTTAICLHNADHGAVQSHLDAKRFFWLDLENPEERRIDALAKQLNLHELTVEDLLKPSTRPKFEEYPGYDYLVAYGVNPSEQAAAPILNEVHLIVSGSFIVTIRDHPMPPLTELRSRYHDQAMRSEEYLIYRILDAVTSTFFPVLAEIDDEVDGIEERIIDQPTQEALQRIFSMKRDLVALRRVVTPLRDVFARNAERIADLPGMEQDDRLYFRDLYDTMIRIADLVDAYRDLLSGATDLYMSTISNRQGQISKQLTLIATIFLPLSYLTGFFGQNFAFLTGKIQTSALSFFGLGIGLELVAITVMVIYFRRKRWL